MVASWLPWRLIVTETVVDDPHVGLSASEKVRSSVSPGSGLPSTLPLPSLIETKTGPAASDGASGPKAAAGPQPAKEMVNPPTAVSGAPVPAAMASVAVEPEIVTPASEPPDGTWASVQPEAHDWSSAPENVTSTWSMRPLWSLSAIWAAISVCFVAGAVVVVVDGPVVVVVVGSVGGGLRSGAPPITMRAVAEWVEGPKAAAPVARHVTETSMTSARSRSTEPGSQGSVALRLSAGRQTTVADWKATRPTSRRLAALTTARLSGLPGTSASM